MNLFFKNLLEKLHLTYKGHSIFSKFYWKAWLDRRKRGFDITDTYSLDIVFAKFMVPRLYAFSQCLLDKNIETGVPVLVHNKIKDKYIKKGYKYDNNSHKFLDQKIDQKVFQEAKDEWFKIINIITTGLQDLVLENENFEEWSSSWKETIDDIKYKIKKCKNINKKSKILEKYGLSYEDYKEGLLKDYYLSGLLRKKSIELLSEYFFSLWW